MAATLHILDEVVTVVGRLALALLLVGTSSVAWGGEPSFKQDEPLNGITLHYKYTEPGWEFELSFYDNKLLYYRLLPGRDRPAEPTNKDLPYHAKRIGKNMYMVNWHETNIKDFVTLVINFETSTVYGSGLLRYDRSPEEQVSFFHGAIIQGVKKGE